MALSRYLTAGHQHFVRTRIDIYLAYWEVIESQTCQPDSDCVGTVKALQTSRKVHLRRYTVACMRTVMCPKHAWRQVQCAGVEASSWSITGKQSSVVTAAAILVRYAGNSCK
jgi:hypothetical protein